MANLSRKDFADRRGVSPGTVTKWGDRGLLVLDADGKIDVEATEWNLDQRPSKYRGGTTHRPIRATRKPEPDPRERPKPRPSAKPLAAKLEGEDGEDEEEGLHDPHNLPIKDAIRRKENFLGLSRKQQFERGERTLVDRAMAEKLFFDTARDARDAWLAWPARVAVEMADELKVDARTLTTVLTAHVHKHVAELGEPEAEFGEPTDKLH